MIFFWEGSRDPGIFRYPQISVKLGVIPSHAMVGDQGKFHRVFLQGTMLEVTFCKLTYRHGKPHFSPVNTIKMVDIVWLC